MQILRLSSAFLCMLAVAFACSATLADDTIDASTQAAIAHARARSEAMTHALARLARECTIGDAAQADGGWVFSTRAQGEPSAQLAEVHSLDAPVETGKFRLAVDPTAGGSWITWKCAVAQR
jgi:hypothetical protein